MEVSSLAETEKQAIKTAFNTMANKGYRVLGVGAATFEGNNFPETQQEFKFLFRGLPLFTIRQRKIFKPFLKIFMLPEFQ